MQRDHNRVMMLPLLARDAEVTARTHRYLLWSFLASCIMFVLFFLYFPPIEIKPYQLRDYTPLEIVYPEEFELPPMPKEVAKPALPIEPADEGEFVKEEVIVPPNTFKSMSEMKPLQTSGHGGVEGGKNVATFSAFDQAPELVKACDPVYPELAKQAGLEGMVLLRLLISRKGRVLDAEVIKSDVTPAMEKAAIAAARNSRFKPAKYRNRPVKAHMVFPVNFTIQ
jgi:protein TonB